MEGRLERVMEGVVSCYWYNVFSTSAPRKEGRDGMT